MRPFWLALPRRGDRPWSATGVVLLLALIVPLAACQATVESLEPAEKGSQHTPGDGGTQTPVEESPGGSSVGRTEVTDPGRLDPTGAAELPWQSLAGELDEGRRARARSTHATQLSGPLAADLAAALHRARAATGSPGASVAVAFRDGTIWYGASGVADVETRERVTPATLFNVASITKTFVAALTMRLIEDGVLRLEDPLSKWVDGVANGDGITIRKLLDHTSGVGDLFSDGGSLLPALLDEPDRVWAPDEVLAHIGTSDPEPGKRWRYSNANYVLLGMIIERATGTTVGRQLRARLLQPVGLRESFLQPDEVGQGPLANGHLMAPGGADEVTLEPSSDGGPYRPDTAWASSVWTAGAMVATARDIARLGDALFDGRVVEPDTLAQMVRFNSEGDYGLGIARKEFGEHVTWGHTGLLRGYTGVLAHFPREGVTLAALTNRHRTDLDRLLIDRHGAGRSLVELALSSANDP